MRGFTRTTKAGNTGAETIRGKLADAEMRANPESRRRMIAALALTVAVLGMGAATAAEEPLVVGYVTKSATNLGWEIINKGARDAAHEAKVKLVVTGPSTYGALQDQANAIDYVLAQGAKAIALAPVDSVGVASAVLRAEAKGVKVVAVDTAVENAEVSSYVATDNLAAAAAQAEWVAANIADDAKIALVEGSQNQSTGRDRRSGFLDRLKQLKPHVAVTEINTSWTLDEARAGVEAAMRKTPTISLIANSWDDGTLGSVIALRSLNIAKGAVKVVGFDGAANALSLMRQGWVQADVAQNLYQQGYRGIQTAIAAARGEQVPPRIDTGHELVTNDNLDAFLEKSKMKPFLK
jgi:ribose transport system substrate-binding protein